MKAGNKLEGLIWNGQDLTMPVIEEKVLYYAESSDIVYFHENKHDLVRQGSLPVTHLAVSDTDVYYGCTNNVGDKGEVIISPIGLGEKSISDLIQILNDLVCWNGKLFAAKETGLYMHEENDLQKYTKISDRYVRNFAIHENHLVDSGPRGLYKTQPEQEFGFTNYHWIASANSLLYGLQMDGSLEGTTLDKTGQDRFNAGELPKGAMLCSEKGELYYLLKDKLYKRVSADWNVQKLEKPIIDFGTDVNDIAWVPLSLHEKVMKRTERKR